MFLNYWKNISRNSALFFILTSNFLDFTFSFQWIKYPAFFILSFFIGERNQEAKQIKHKKTLPPQNQTTTEINLSKSI